MNYTRSKQEFERALELFPGGTNSPVRAFKSVGGTPIFIKKAKGSKIVDIDGNAYIDYVASWGPMIHGHAYQLVLEALKKAAKLGTSFGAPTILESDLAEMIISMVPSIQMLRMVSSGTEATMSAIRLARGYTGKTKIIKFAGCYHGHADSFLIKAGSGAATLGLPDSPGVTPGTAGDTLIAEYNDLASVEKLFSENGKNIAAVIVEPVTGNMGVVLPVRGFLEGLRKITEKNNSLLIFDEVITGFRVAKGGAQEYYGVKPDLTTLGKIIGGGLPVGAYGGKKEIMMHMAPAGNIYQAGTLSGNPLAMIAGLTTLRAILDNPTFYADMEKKSKMLEDGIKKNLNETGVKAIINRIGSMFTLFFLKPGDNQLTAINNLHDALKADKERYAKYFSLSLEAGIYLAPSQFECAFISSSHTDFDIERTIDANLNVLKKL